MTQPRFKKGDYVVWPAGMPCVGCGANHTHGHIEAYVDENSHVALRIFGHADLVAVHPKALFHPAELALLEATNPKGGL